MPAIVCRAAYSPAASALAHSKSHRLVSHAFTPHCHNRRRPCNCAAFTTYYTAPAVHPPTPPLSSASPAATTANATSLHAPRLRVSLLSAPTHLGHFTSRVTRLSNEDRYSIGMIQVPASTSLTPRSRRVTLPTATTAKPHMRDVFYYSIFDGHGGADCSDFLARHLANYIETCDVTTAEELERKWRDNIGGYWSRWKGHFERYRRMITDDNDLPLRIPLAFLQADYDYIVAERPAGSTCTSVLIYGDKDSIGAESLPYFAPGASATMLVAHVGDTRCVLCDRNGLAHALTAAHHLSSPIESSRLRRYAASFFTDSFGEERFGNVENTRAFGDRAMKGLGVSAEPDMTTYSLGAGPDAHDGFGGNESFLVLVSDGVSKFVSDQEIVDIVTSVGYRSGYVRGTPQDAAKEVVNFAEAIGGDDNATCLVVRLSGWGSWTSPVDRTGDLREYRLRQAMETRRQ
ncbi:phosphatase 2C-like domain-containing protein [Limtongia smithiae]|uniref:phosphatase 2C-like domain-containing protein n=1 Tax=Limtongia smithiae TaxID=1125753 RepID=UPI0034CE3CF4